MARLKHVTVCEDVRPEQHNKVTLVGVYLKDIFFLEDDQWKDKGVVVLKSLSFFCEFEDIPANAPITWSLRGPEDVVLCRRESGHASSLSEAAGPTVFVFSISPCPFRSEGTHTLVVEIGEEQFDHSFDVHVVDELPP